MIDEGKILSWEEVQKLALPPDAAMLVPPSPSDNVPALTTAPSGLPDWLTEEDPEAARAAAEREQFGPGPVRLITQLVAVNAIWQAGQSFGRPKPSDGSRDEDRRRRSDESTPLEEKP